MKQNNSKRKTLIPSGIWCITTVIVLFGYLGMVMGVPNMLNTIMRTAHDLLLNTVFYLMSICVITGAIGKVFVEFGVVTLLERTLRPLMRPIFNLPGVTSLGAVMTFLSDNPAWFCGSSMFSVDLPMRNFKLMLPLLLRICFSGVG
jgi:nucleoside recognition membrane protein YjiH